MMSKVTIRIEEDTRRKIAVLAHTRSIVTGKRVTVGSILRELLQRHLADQERGAASNH